MRIPEIVTVQSEHRAGSLASVLQVIGDAGLVVEGLRATTRDHHSTTWEVTLEPEDEQILEAVLEGIESLPNAHILGRSDRVFDRHRGGKIQTIARLPINTLERLRDLYTPGVARVCLAIQQEPSLAWEFTNRPNTVAIVTNGTAVLGLGGIGALAGLPVMEGKAALMAQFADLSGVPILIEETEPAPIVEAVAAIAPSFGAIQLEDIRAPECFAIEAALRERLDMPVMHDDRRGTAAVVLSALLGAARSAEVDLKRSIVGQIGLGAAGIGIAELLISYGVRVVGADLQEEARQRLADLGGEPLEQAELMATADIVVATTGVRGLIKPEMVRPGQVILALSNPEAEIEPETALAAGARFAADGKVVNNVLGFPGIFRGALDARARRITNAMLIAAAETLADLTAEDELVPDSLDPRVHQQVAVAVRHAAERERLG